MKVKDLLPMEIDVDVYDDVCEEIAIAYCGANKLTPEGEKKFAEVLEYDITLHEIRGFCIVHIDGDDWKRKLKLAKEFFYSIAGYCDDDDFNKWFIIL